ncbi:MAG TPA: hypothetical protein PLX97_12820 [Gemmatales bacterium]|nr:hypothetical protein [Gemmatales bacterium]
MAISQNSQFIVSGSWDQNAILWDASSGKKIHTFSGHTATVNSVAISKDGQRVITGASDGTLRIWNGKTGKALATLIHFRNGKDWIVTTPEGQFDGSPGVDRLVAFRHSGSLKLMPQDQHRKQFERPGLLAAILNIND